jgi:copper chaperone CopZ
VLNPQFIELMKISRLVGVGLLAVGSVVFAGESKVTLKGVHLCCNSCVHGVEDAVKGMKGVSAKADKDAETVTLVAEDGATLQKAVDALAAGGYFGVAEGGDVKPMANTGASNKNVKSMIVTGTHLCCGGCVKAVDRAVKETPGATAHTAKKNGKTFVVTGDFNDQKFFEALQKEGLSGRVTDKEIVTTEKSDGKSDH